MNLSEIKDLITI